MSRHSQHPLLSRRALMFGALAAGASMAFNATAEAATLTVRGEVMYRERMALPPGARIEVQLAEAQRPGAKPRIVASVRAGASRGSPIPFTLRVNDRQLAKGRRYVLEARISDSKGVVMFSNFAGQPWSPGSGPVSILVTRAVAGPVRPPQPATPWGSWLAEDILGGGVLDRAQARLTIAPDGRVSGNSGCNSVNGNARVSGRNITFGRMGMTMRACAPALMEQERRFNRALGLVRSFRVEGERRRLLLLDKGNRVVMRLSAMS